MTLIRKLVNVPVEFPINECPNCNRFFVVIAVWPKEDTAYSDNIKKGVDQVATFCYSCGKRMYNE